MQHLQISYFSGWNGFKKKERGAVLKKGRNIGKIPYLTFLKGEKHNKYENIQNIVEQKPEISSFSGWNRFLKK